VVFVVKTSEGDDFAIRRISTLEMAHFGPFSVAKEAAVTETCPPSPLPNKYDSGVKYSINEKHNSRMNIEVE